MTDDKSLLQSLFNDQVEITELYPEPTYDDLKVALQNYLNPSDEDDTQEVSTPKVDPATTVASNVADDFDALFNSN